MENSRQVQTAEFIKTYNINILLIYLQYLKYVTPKTSAIQKMWYFFCYFVIFVLLFLSLYDAKKKYSGTRPTVDDEFRSGILEINNTEAQLIQGSFRQMSAKFDYVVDPEVIILTNIIPSDFIEDQILLNFFYFWCMSKVEYLLPGVR